MRKYELVCIFHPDLDEASFAANVEKIKAWIAEAGGTVDKVDNWGRRKLAYHIRKQKEGQYILFNITLPPSASGTIDTNLRFLETVLRYMLTVVD